MKFTTVIYCFIMITLVSENISHAEEIILKSSILSMSEYNDNIFYSRDNDQSDFIMAVIPELNIIYNTETMQIYSALEGSYYRYKENSRLSGAYYDLNFSGNKRLTEKGSFTTQLAIKKEESLRAGLAETGIITDFNDRDTLTMGIGYKYTYSEDIEMSINWSYSDVKYASLSGVDNKGHTVSVFLSKDISSQADTFFIQQSYSAYDSIISNTDSLGLYAGWTHQFDETLSISGYIGGRYTETRYPTLTDEGWGGVANLSLTKNSETWQSGMEIGRDLKFSSYGVPVESDQLSINFSRDITLYLRYRINLAATESRSSSGIRRNDTRYYTVNNAMEYRLSKDIVMSVNYTYGDNADLSNRNEASLSRNIFHINLKWDLAPIFY
jgi:predicted porin